MFCVLQRYPYITCHITSYITLLLMISAFTSPASEGGVVKKYPPGDASEGRWLFPGRRRFGHFGRCLKVDLSDHIFACFTVHISGKRWMGKKNKSQNISVLWMLKREMKTRGKPPFCKTIKKNLTILLFCCPAYHHIHPPSLFLEHLREVFPIATNKHLRLNSFRV